MTPKLGCRSQLLLFACGLKKKKKKPADFLFHDRQVHSISCWNWYRVFIYLFFQLTFQRSVLSQFTQNGRLPVKKKKAWLLEAFFNLHPLLIYMSTRFWVDSQNWCQGLFFGGGGLEWLFIGMHALAECSLALTIKVEQKISRVHVSHSDDIMATIHVTSNRGGTSTNPPNDKQE